MIIRLRLLNALLQEIHLGLSRPHSFAAERVGFLTCGVADTRAGGLLLLGQQWHAVADEDYIDNNRVGACIGPNAFRRILQYAYQHRVSILHVHRHEHYGVPRFSATDEASMKEFTPGFANASPAHPHGALVLSKDAATGVIRLPERPSFTPISRFEVIGTPLRHWNQT